MKRGMEIRAETILRIGTEINKKQNLMETECE